MQFLVLFGTVLQFLAEKNDGFMVSSFLSGLRISSLKHDSKSQVITKFEIKLWTSPTRYNFGENFAKFHFAIQFEALKLVFRAFGSQKR